MHSCGVARWCDAFVALASSLTLAVGPEGGLRLLRIRLGCYCWWREVVEVMWVLMIGRDLQSGGCSVGPCVSDTA